MTNACVHAVTPQYARPAVESALNIGPIPVQFLHITVYFQEWSMTQNFEIVS